MRIFTGRPGIFVIFAIGSLLAAPARAVVLDWDSVTWNPGELTNSYDVTGDGVNDITIQMTSQQANVWALDATTGTQTPVVNQTMTGGLVPAQSSLLLAANLHTNSNAGVQISFTGVPGVFAAQNVSFTLFDIDLTADRDIISNIYGIAPDGTHIAATISNVGSSVILTGSGLTQTLTDLNPVADNSSNGNATISFGGAVVTDVFFTWGNSAGPPKFQDLGIGDITFTPVPEINPAAMSVASCLVAAGMVVLAHRRAKGRQNSQDESKS
jgi:hypothetical protein